MSDLLVTKTASLSDCRSYRYTLSRHWDERRRALAFIMLNPSTADADVDDPTIRRCVAFARREGFGGIVVANLFAFRAVTPSRLMLATDPVGPGNGAALSRILMSAGLWSDPVVCAWGAHRPAEDHAGRLVDDARTLGVGLKCLGKTKGGSPRHPLYVRADQPFEAYP